MAERYRHLRLEARAIAALGDEERIHHIYRERWIPHPRAQLALTRMDFLFSFPRCTRMPCLLVYGDSGIGKTMLVEKFRRDHPSSFDNGTGIETMPVIAMEMPASPDEKRVYMALLTAIGAPSGPVERLHRLEDRCIRLLRTINPQLLMIDEVHNLLAGTPREQRRALNLLKSLANRLRVAIVALGTNEALTAVQTDAQVASRFEPLQMPRWKASEQFRSFLTGYLKGLPLRKPSNIDGRDAITLLLNRSAGVTGRITLILAKAAEMAIRKSSEAVSLALLDAASRHLHAAPEEAS